MKKFVTLFYKIEDVHFYKDIGMIPYHMKKLFHYDSYIACSKINSKINNKKYKNIKIDEIKCIFNNEFLDSLIYILKKSKQIDILNLYHYRRKTLIFIFLYKLLNKNGKVYLKLDGESLNKSKNMKSIYKYILKKCTIISTEVYSSYNELKNKFNFNNFEYIPNGAYIPKIIDDKKENIICFSGRIGSPEKSVNTLVEAFIKIYNKVNDWRLYLVGPMTDEFKNYLDNKYKEYSGLKEKIIVVGNIEDREVLFKIYNKSKIFCLPSLNESFGISAIEAMSQGCYLVLSDFISSNDLTYNEKLGTIFRKSDVEDLSEKLFSLCKKDNIYFENKANKLKKYYRDVFDYGVNCKKIDEKLKI